MNNWQNFILCAFNFTPIFILCKQKMKPVQLKSLESLFELKE